MKNMKRGSLVFSSFFITLFFSVSSWAHPDHAAENISQFMFQLSEGASPLALLLISLTLLATLTTVVEIRIKSKKDDER